MLADLTESRAAAAYAALVEIERLAALLPSAPELADRMALADVITQRHAYFRTALDRYASHDPRDAMTSAAPALDDARQRLEAGDWWEGLATVALSAPLTDELFAALTGDDAGNDFASGHLEADNAASSSDAVPADVSSDSAARWAATRLRAAIDGDPILAARLALWSRRVVGEAIVLARVFGAERYRELSEKLTASHAARLSELGLAG